MKTWRQYLDGPEAWDFLRKVASATTGKEVEVYPGNYPMASRVFPHRHLSRITLPAHWLGRPHEGYLRGCLSHELLHVMFSDPEALAGIPWGVFVLAQGLEDARIETQSETRWPGLACQVKALAREVTTYLTRQRQLAHDASTSKLYDVTVALYMFLMGANSTVVTRILNEMAALIAAEVLPLARPALQASTSAEVVEIAKKIVEELERAAQRAAEKANTPEARSYFQSFRSELEQAMRQTVEQVFIRLSTVPRPSQWWGPWYRGSGGHPFHPVAWKWDTSGAPLLVAPAEATLIRWLMEADPHHEVEEVRIHQPAGRLAPKSRDLVQAALGRTQRVFTRTFRTQRLVLPHLLGTTEFVFLIEAHKWYDPSAWSLLLGTVSSLARLLTFCHSQFIVRAWTVTRPEEEVEDPVSKRRYVRPANEFYVHISTLKGPEDRWDGERELELAALPRQGFNNPLEGYDRGTNWGLNLPAPVRKRVVLCFGDARRLNLGYGQLEYATSHLRKPKQKAVYVHVGSSIPFYDSLAGELDSQFDGWVQARTVHEAVMRSLRVLLILLAK